MISSKLKMLERQLVKVGGRDVDSESGSSTKALLAFQAVVEEEANAAIKKAEEKQHKAEAMVADLLKQITRLNEQLMQAHKDAVSKMEDMEESYDKEEEKMCAMHHNEMDQMRSLNDALRNQVSAALQDIAKLQAEKEASEKMCKHMEGMIAKMQAVKPVAAPTVTAAPAASPARPVTAKVTQRDENGRIVAISITPSS